MELESQQFRKLITFSCQLLGFGGFGKVFHVKSENNNYAMKVIDVETVTHKYMQDSPLMTPIRPIDTAEKRRKIWNSIFKEVKILKKLNHENIVKIYYYYTDKSLGTSKIPRYLYIFLEYSAYGSLLKYIKSSPKKRIPEFVARGITCQVVSALVYLANESVIHGDIKAANILLFRDGSVKLCDFGLSFQWDDTNSNDYNDDISTVTNNNKLQRLTANGSAYWLAPEIILHRMSSPKSDIWSLGATIIEMLTGVPPFGNHTPLAACHAIGNKSNIPYPENISDLGRHFLDLCFQFDPVLRARAKTLMSHKWIQDSNPRILENIEEVCDENAFEGPNNVLEKYKETPEDGVLDDEFEEISDVKINMKKLELQNSDITKSIIGLLDMPTPDVALIVHLLNKWKRHFKLRPQKVEELCLHGLLAVLSRVKLSPQTVHLIEDLVTGIRNASDPNLGLQWLYISGFKKYGK